MKVLIPCKLITRPEQSKGMREILSWHSNFNCHGSSWRTTICSNFEASNSYQDIKTRMYHRVQGQLANHQYETETKSETETGCLENSGLFLIKTSKENNLAPLEQQQTKGQQSTSKGKKKGHLFFSITDTATHKSSSNSSEFQPTPRTADSWL